MLKLPPKRESIPQGAKTWKKYKSDPPITFILLLLHHPKNIFFIFSPKIACQAPKPSKPNKQNKIELAF